MQFFVFFSVFQVDKYTKLSCGGWFFLSNVNVNHLPQRKTPLPLPHFYSSFYSIFIKVGFLATMTSIKSHCVKEEPNMLYFPYLDFSIFLRSVVGYQKKDTNWTKEKCPFSGGIKVCDRLKKVLPKSYPQQKENIWWVVSDKLRQYLFSINAFFTFTMTT